MPSFYFEALQHNGKTKKGTIVATAEEQALDLLRKDKLRPIKLYLKSPSESNRVHTPDDTKNKLSLSRQGAQLNEKSKLIFTRQLASMLEAGISLKECVQSIGNTSRDKAISTICSDLSNRINEGETLATAMAQHRRTFDNLYCALIQAGELSGRLDVILTKLSEYLEQQQDTKNKIRQALLYPAILTAVAIAIIVLLLSTVMPKLMVQFENASLALPWLTRALLALSNGINQYGGITIGLFITLIFGYKFIVVPSRFYIIVHRALLKIPMLKDLFIQRDISRYIQTMSILTSAGIPIQKAVIASQSTIENMAIKHSLESTTESLSRGQSLYDALKLCPYFDDISLLMINNGERSGNLAGAFEKAAHLKTKSLQQSIDFGLAILEPLIIVLMGGAVFAIVLAILLPIMQLNELVLG